MEYVWKPDETGRGIGPFKVVPFLSFVKDQKRPVSEYPTTLSELKSALKLVNLPSLKVMHPKRVKLSCKVANFYKGLYDRRARACPSPYNVQWVHTDFCKITWLSKLYLRHFQYMTYKFSGRFTDFKVFFLAVSTVFLKLSPIKNLKNLGSVY